MRRTSALSSPSSCAATARHFGRCASHRQLTRPPHGPIREIHERWSVRTPDTEQLIEIQCIGSLHVPSEVVLCRQSSCADERSVAATCWLVFVEAASGTVTRPHRRPNSSAEAVAWAEVDRLSRRVKDEGHSGGDRGGARGCLRSGRRASAKLPRGVLSGPFFPSRSADEGPPHPRPEARDGGHARRSDLGEEEEPRQRPQLGWRPCGCHRAVADEERAAASLHQ
jgi:hypothetical protein